MRKRKRIICMQGHGGRDPGASHPDGKTTELDITKAATPALAMALNLLGYEAIQSPAAVLAKNEKMGINERVSWANSLRDITLFVSIHANASMSHAAEGSEVLYFRKGKVLAENLAPAVAIIPARDRGAKYRDDLGVLKRTNMPAVMIELGFCDDNDHDKFDDTAWMLKHWPAQVGAAAMVIHKYLEGFK